MFSLLPMTQYPPTLVTNLFSSQQSIVNLKRNMRLHLLLWLLVNGLPVQLDCDPDHIISTLQTCVGGCFVKPANIISACIQKCTITKATTEKQCDGQKGKIKFILNDYQAFCSGM